MNIYPNIQELRAIVIEAAEEELLSRCQGTGFECKGDGSMVTETDIAMQRFLQTRLAERWPEYVLLGEEMPESEQQRVLKENAAGAWVLDPLDGTSNYAAGFPFFSVSLALLVRGRPVVGLVYDPMRRECFHAAYSVAS